MVSYPNWMYCLGIHNFKPCYMQPTKTDCYENECCQNSSCRSTRVIVKKPWVYYLGFWWCRDAAEKGKD